MKNQWTVFLACLGILPLLGAPSNTYGANETATQIEKTFDYGTLIEHTIRTRRGPHRAVLHLSQRRRIEKSPVIISSRLAFRYETHDGHALMTVPVFESLLAEMINTLHGRFGNGLNPESLGAGGFMGIKTVEKNSILAFSGYEPWTKYLENPKAFSQLEIYSIVYDRWKATGIFSTITRTLVPLGYKATFSGFEKLFVFPAEKCSFYPELEDLGIRKMDRFPYPGSISFNLVPKQ